MYKFDNLCSVRSTQTRIYIIHVYNYTYYTYTPNVLYIVHDIYHRLTRREKELGSASHTHTHTRWIDNHLWWLIRICDRPHNPFVTTKRIHVSERIEGKKIARISPRWYIIYIVTKSHENPEICKMSTCGCKYIETYRSAEIPTDVGHITNDYIRRRYLYPFFSLLFFLATCLCTIRLLLFRFLWS